MDKKADAWKKFQNEMKDKRSSKKSVRWFIYSQPFFWLL